MSLRRRMLMMGHARFGGISNFSILPHRRLAAYELPVNWIDCFAMGRTGLFITLEMKYKFVFLRHSYGRWTCAQFPSAPQWIVLALQWQNLPSFFLFFPFLCPMRNTINNHKPFRAHKLFVNEEIGASALPSGRMFSLLFQFTTQLSMNYTSSDLRFN